jgi:imidazolonepropionase-like amidohydrolase
VVTRFPVQELPQGRQVVVERLLVKALLELRGLVTLQLCLTSARDAGGPVFGLNLAIDTGVVPGPRVWQSGAFASQSGGAWRRPAAQRPPHSNG